MFFHEKPGDFKGQREVANCFVECDGKILLLLRRPDPRDPQSGRWGLPGGVVERGEFEFQTIWRELPEETGIEVKRDEAVYIRKLYIRYDDEIGKSEFVLYLFYLSRNEKPDVTINAVNKQGVKEHTEYRWVTPDEALRMNLMTDLEKFIKLHYPQKEVYRGKTSANQ